MLSTDRCGLIALGETNGRLRLGLSALVVDRLAAARSAHRAGLEHPEEPLCPRMTIGCSTARTVLPWSREAAAESAGGSSLKLTRAAAVAEPQIVFITSVSSTFASVNRGEYCVAKAGLSMVAHLFAVRLAGLGIRVYCEPQGPDRRRDLALLLHRREADGSESTAASPRDRVDWLGQQNLFCGWKGYYASGPAQTLRVPSLAAFRSMWNGSDQNSREILRGCGEPRLGMALLATKRSWEQRLRTPASPRWIWTAIAISIWCCRPMDQPRSP